MRVCDQLSLLTENCDLCKGLGTRLATLQVTYTYVPLDVDGAGVAIISCFGHVYIRL